MATVEYDLKEVLAKLESRLEKLEGVIESKFEKMESKFEKLENNLNAKIEKIEKDIEKIGDGSQKQVWAVISIIALAVIGGLIRSFWGVKI